ncbi:MAG: hypothetical protein ACRC6V_03265 [Bacteroidales bacterium]
MEEVKAFVHTPIKNTCASKNEWFYLENISVYLLNCFTYRQGVKHHTIVISNITVKEDVRGTGLFTRFMNDLIGYMMTSTEQRTLLVVQSILEPRLFNFLRNANIVLKDINCRFEPHGVASGDTMSLSMIIPFRAFKNNDHELPFDSLHKIHLLSSQFSEQDSEALAKDLEDAFAVQVFNKRLSAYGFEPQTLNTQLFVATFARSPGDVVLLAHRIAWELHSLNKNVLSPEDLGALLLTIAPTKEAFSAFWDTQRFGGNFLDRTEAWPIRSPI